MRNSDTTLINYLAAARAAQQQGAYDRRDLYLKSAIEDNPDADIAVSLTQAELQLAHNQTEYALATLTRLRSLAPQHLYVIKLLAKLYWELADWKSLSELLPELKRRKLFPSARMAELEQKSWTERIKITAATSTDALKRLWQAMPVTAKEIPIIVHTYVLELLRHHLHQEAEVLLRTTLNTQWDEQLIKDYGDLNLDSIKILETAEAWLSYHERSPYLLLTLGRLSVKQQLWGKAKSYFEASLSIKPMLETYKALGELSDLLSDPTTALEAYRKGIELILPDTSKNKSTAPSLARTTTQQRSPKPLAPRLSSH